MRSVKILSYVLAVVLIIAVFLVNKLALIKVSDPTVQDANYIHYSSTVVDTHNDTLGKIISEDWFPEVDLGKDTPFEVDIPKLKNGGINVQFFAICSPERFYTRQTLSHSLALLNGLHHTLANNTNSIGLAGSFEDMNKLLAADKIVAIAALEGIDYISDPYGLELLQQLFDLGIRAVSLTWNDSNRVAEGYSGTFYHDQPSFHQGLSDYGKQVIMHLASLGIIIDVSHLAQNSFWDVIEIIETPVIASHSSVYSLRNHVRNLTDDQILAIAKTDGVIQIVFHTDFLSHDPDEVSVETVVDHIEYVINLAGIDHVGLGSDFDGGFMPADLANASMMPKITQELIARGYAKADIEKILGKNTLRVMNKILTKADSTETSGNIFVPLNPSYMGEIINSSNPILSTKLNSLIEPVLDSSSLQVIVNGKNYRHIYNQEDRTLSAKITDPLEQGFHVVTFAARSYLGQVIRKTLIFYVN